jgi:hypothetical protein
MAYMTSQQPTHTSNAHNASTTHMHPPIANHPPLGAAEALSGDNTLQMVVKPVAKDNTGVLSHHTVDTSTTMTHQQPTTHQQPLLASSFSSQPFQQKTKKSSHDNDEFIDYVTTRQK